MTEEINASNLIHEFASSKAEWYLHIIKLYLGAINGGNKQRNAIMDTFGTELLMDSDVTSSHADADTLKDELCSLHEEVCFNPQNGSCKIVLNKGVTPVRVRSCIIVEGLHDNNFPLLEYRLEGGIWTNCGLPEEDLSILADYIKMVIVRFSKSILRRFKETI